METGAMSTASPARPSRIWPRPVARTPGLLAASFGNAHGNIQVEYAAGYLRPLPEIGLAANELVAQLRKWAADGGPLSSERYDYYQYARLDSGQEALLIGSVSHLLKRFKKWTW